MMCIEMTSKYLVCAAAAVMLPLTIGSGCGDSFVFGSGNTGGTATSSSSNGQGGQATTSSMTNNPTTSTGQGGNGQGGQEPTDPCDECTASHCPERHQGCFGNPACLALADCLSKCGDSEDCVNQCLGAHSDGISDLLLMLNCQSTVCVEPCGGTTSYSNCEICIYENCAEQLNKCYGFTPCRELADCMNECPAFDTGCLQQCHNKWPDGKPGVDAVRECAYNNCQGAC